MRWMMLPMATTYWYKRTRTPQKQTAKQVKPLTNSKLWIMITIAVQIYISKHREMPRYSVGSITLKRICRKEPLGEKSPMVATQSISRRTEPCLVSIREVWVISMHHKSLATLWRAASSWKPKTHRTWSWISLNQVVNRTAKNHVRRMNQQPRKWFSNRKSIIKTISTLQICSCHRNP